MNPVEILGSSWVKNPLFSVVKPEHNLGQFLVSDTPRGELIPQVGEPTLAIESESRLAVVFPLGHFGFGFDPLGFENHPDGWCAETQVDNKGSE